MNAIAAPSAAAPLAKHNPQSNTSYWLWMLCLLGVDYFSTLSYQPSLTYEVAGKHGPLATLIVVLVTLCAALPVYLYVARHSPHGQGSIALLERLIGGWSGKTLILILLGFATTDFIMLKSISLADAAEHILHNEDLRGEQYLKTCCVLGKGWCQENIGDELPLLFTEQMLVTLVLGVVGFIFWYLLRRGFNQKIIAIAVPLVAVYMLLNAIVIGGGLLYLWERHELVTAWFADVRAGQWQQGQPLWAGSGWGELVLLCVVMLPRLSLGLSGFEMSVIVMPQVRGRASDTAEDPRGRIVNTRKLLLLAALIMSVYLLGAVFVTTLLIPHTMLQPGCPANNRALAYLAHGGALSDGGQLLPWLGPLFGGAYDVVTVLVLVLAGTSVMTALGALLPRFLLRFGMELKWANRWGVLFMLFALFNTLVTLLFHASVQEQRDAYATGVLALICGACLTVAADRWRTSRSQHWLRRVPWRNLLIALVFLATFATVVILSPSGMLIASCFIGIILASSVVARAIRTDELRTIGFEFADEQSKLLWDTLRYLDFPVLVPHRPGLHARREKEVQIRQDHQLDPATEIVFLEIEIDDPSNFFQNLRIEVFREERNFVIRVSRCVSIAHAIAAIALEMSRHSKPPGLHFGWSEMDLLAASWSYLAFGEGNVPWKVRELILEAEPDRGKQPRVVIG